MHIDDEQLKNQRGIEALRNGVPNRDAVSLLGCNQPEIEEKFRQHLENTKHALTSGGRNEGILVAGDFGTGKSHLLEYLTNIALEKNFVCSKIVISKETPLFDSAKLYRAAAEAAIVPKKVGSAMDEIATALKFTSANYVEFFKWSNRDDGLNARFAASLFLYERVQNDPELSNRIIRFWSGDKMGAGEMKKYLRACQEAVTYKIDKIPAKEFALQRFKFAARLIMAAGYSGWVLLVDEVEMISKYSLMQRAKSYVELARLMGELEESNMNGLTSVLTISEDFQKKILEETADFEKVPNRLRSKGTESDLLAASQAERGMRVIQNDLMLLKVPSKDMLGKTYENIKSIHAKAYHWNPPPAQSIKDLTSNKMRQYVKGWITEWDLKRLYPDYKPEIEVVKLEQDFTEDKDIEVAAEESPIIAS